MRAAPALIGEDGAAPCTTNPPKAPTQAKKVEAGVAEGNRNPADNHLVITTLGVLPNTSTAVGVCLFLRPTNKPVVL